MNEKLEQSELARFVFWTSGRLILEILKRLFLYFRSFTSLTNHSSYFTQMRVKLELQFKGKSRSLLST